MHYSAGSNYEFWTDEFCQIIGSGKKLFLVLNGKCLYSDGSCLLAAAFLTQTVCLEDTTVKFEIWDTAGQERYHSLAPMYYRGAQAAIVVYDITNQVSFSLQ